MKRLALPLACRQEQDRSPLLFQISIAQRLKAEERRGSTPTNQRRDSNGGDLSKWLTRFRVYQRLLECNLVFPVDDSEPCHGALLCS